MAKIQLQQHVPNVGNTTTKQKYHTLNQAKSFGKGLVLGGLASLVLPRGTLPDSELGKIGAAYITEQVRNVMQVINVKQYHGNLTQRIIDSFTDDPSFVAGMYIGMHSKPVADMVRNYLSS